MTGVLVPLAPIMTEMTIKNSDDYQVWDRSYRIRNNEGQVHHQKRLLFCNRKNILFSCKFANKKINS